jgi:hypothetical protein
VTTRRDYNAEALQAVKNVLIELVQILGEFRDHIVVVGGSVPGLLVRDAAEPHIGTLDIDLALDFRNIPEASYQTLLKALTSRGYRQGGQPFQFFRDVPLANHDPITVEVDLLAGEYGGTGGSHRTQVVQDARARKARGCDLVFENNEVVSIEGALPGGGRLTVQCRVAAIGPFLVMKGMALADRLKEKDAYDIYYCVRRYPGGVVALANQFRPHIENRLVREGLIKIKDKFGSPEDAGPKWVADFLEIIDREERQIQQRAAYEQITALLELLGICAGNRENSAQ